MKNTKIIFFKKKPIFKMVFPILILVFAAVVHSILDGKLPLTGDEAYYWTWSRHLALGYHDQPPLVAWIIAFFSIFGKTVFWVRFPAVILTFFSGFLFFLFSKDLCGSYEKGIMALFLFLFTPILAVISLAIFPDIPLLFSWSLFLWSSWKWLQDDRFWVVMGIAFGLAMLSKLMGLFLFPSFLLFLVLSENHRSFLKKTSLWMSLFLSLIAASPFLYWNFLHHFQNFAYQFDFRLERKLIFSTSLFLTYLSLEMFVLFPLIFAMVVGVLLWLFRRAFQKDWKAIYVLSMALPIILFFFAASFFIHVGLHWALPGYLALFAVLPEWAYSARLKIFPVRKWMISGKSFLVFSLACSFCFSSFLFSILFWPKTLIPWISSLNLRYRDVNHGQPIKTQSLSEVLGYRKLGRAVLHDYGEICKTRKCFVFTDSYSLSSIISFYSNLPAKTILFTSMGGEYSQWDHWKDGVGDNALYVDTQPIGTRLDIDSILQKAFKKINPLPSLSVKEKGFDAKTFYFARCQDLVAPSSLEPMKNG